MLKFITGLIDRDSHRDRFTNRKNRYAKSNLTTADQSWLSQLKQPKVWIPVSLLVAVVLFLILFKVEYQASSWKMEARDWTGFGQSYDNDVAEVTEKGTETTDTSKKETTKTTTTTKRLQSAKTLWDWMTLLLAPATLAGLGFLFQSSQEKAKRDKEEADKARDADQQREQALQTYFDQLSELLVDKQLKKLLPARHVVAEKPELLIDAQAALDVVKARTLALLRMFDQDIPRKASVLSFLGDVDLLSQLDLDLIFVWLNGAYLKKVNFSGCKLRGANLQSAILSDANLQSAILSDVNLVDAILIGVNLNRAYLVGADLSRADLRSADLSGADLSRADFRSADLRSADLRSANLNRAKFWKSDLSRSDLSGAYLTFTDLKGADLSYARFWDADLTGADLDRAKKDAVANIQSATNWQTARYDPEMRGLLGLPPETSEDQNTAV